MSNKYNFEMNDNDVADQYRLVYMMQRFQRNQKWWWALWLWGMEVSLVNAFMMMRRYCKLKGVKQKIDHHEFNELIGRALLDPVNEWTKGYKKNGKTESGKRKRPPTATRQALRFTSETLCHTRVVLNKLLDRSLNHLPVQSPRDDDDKKKGNSIVC